MALLGIDFGTANVRIAAAPERGEPSPSAISVTPSVVSFNGGNVASGEAVLMMAGVVPDLVVPATKRLLGREATDPVVERLAARHSYAVSDEKWGISIAPLEDESGVSGTLDPVRGAAAAIRYGSEQISGSKPHRAVVTIPGWFGPPQREALSAVMKQAGITVVRYVRDVVASALWAAHAHRVHGRLVVLDVGAGGVSGGLLQVDAKRVALLASAGSAAWGGDDVDAELATTAVADADRRTFELVRQACEALKRTLATTDEASREVTVGGDAVHITLQRWELDLMLGALGKTIGDVVGELFAGDHDPAEVDKVLAFGGMCGVAGVRREIASAVEAPTDQSAPRTDATVLGALRLAMAVTEQRRMQLSVVDGESDEAVPGTDISSPPPMSRGGEGPLVKGLVTGAPVVKRKPVLRNRPQVVRKRIDPQRARRRGKGTGANADGSPSEAPADDAAAGLSDVETAAGPSAPPPAGSSPPRAGSSPRPAAPSPRPKASSQPPAGSSPRPAAPSPRPKASSQPPAGSSPRPAGSSPPAVVSSPRPPPAESSPPAAVSSPAPSGPPVASESPASAPRRSEPPSPRQPSAPPARVAQPPPPPDPSGPKYPARDGMRRYPQRDRPLRAPKVPDLHDRRRQASTQPSERPGSQPPTSDPDRSSSPPGRSSIPDAWSGSPSAPPAGSLSPPAGRPSIAPSAIPREGTLVGLKTAKELLALPMTGPITPDELEPISLPLLLRRVVGRRNVHGTLEIRADDFELRIDCDGGTANLTKPENNQLMRAFDLEHAEWRLLSTREEESMRAPRRISRIALEGIRRILQRQPEEACREALADRLDRAPRVRPDKQRILKLLSLSGRERRFIEQYFDGLQNAADLGDTGPLGASGCFQLLILLELFDALEWSAVEALDDDDS